MYIPNFNKNALYYEHTGSPVVSQSYKVLAHLTLANGVPLIKLLHHFLVKNIIKH